MYVHTYVRYFNCLLYIDPTPVVMANVTINNDRFEITVSWQVCI